MSQPNQIAQERMFLSADKSKVLPEGHKDAAFLYASVGDEIPASACERFGIKDGKAPTPKTAKKSAPTPTPTPTPAKAKAKPAPAKTKAKPAPANKEKAPAENKEAAPSETKEVGE